RPDKMLRRDGGAYVGRGGGDEIDGLARRDVLQNDLERREITHDPGKHTRDEYPLTVEYIDIGVGDFAMNEQREPMLLHGSERVVCAGHLSDPRLRVRRRASRIIFEPDDEPRCASLRNVVL